MASAPSPPEPRITVIVTVLNDRRVERTLRSLQAQTLPPIEILIADGGSKDGTFELCATLAQTDPRIKPLRVLGTIPESRNQALDHVHGDLVAFLDADEVAPPGWLAALVAPFSDPTVGFTGGPTPAMKGTTPSLGAQYYDAYLRRFYETVARHHPHALPMGNSAWRLQVFQKVGRLDSTLFPKAASEDQDMALRTLKAGWKGVYVPEAWVDHDFSDLYLRALLRKQATYATGGYVVWRRSGSTYEASPSGLTPYLLPPALLLFGFVVFVLPWSWAGWVGLGLMGLGALLFFALVVALAVEGRLGDHQYPGWRLRPLEILRRYATLYGALRGLLRYGWSGRRNLPSAPATPGHR